VFRASQEDDLEAIKFAAEDVDVILKRSHVVRYAEDGADGAIKVQITGDADGGAAAPAASAPAPSGKSTFSKATFVSKEGGEELSLDDPDFWSKLGLQDQSLPEPTAPSLTGPGEVLDFKRVRKERQIFNLGGDADAADADAIGLSSDSGDDSEASDSGDYKGTAKKKLAAQGEEAEYRPPVKHRLHAGRIGLRKAAPPTTAPHAVASVGPETNGNVQPNGAAVSSASSHPPSTAAAPVRFTDGSSVGRLSSLRSQYERLLATYKITHPGKSATAYEQLANTLWRNVFKTEPPGLADVEAPVASAASTPKPSQLPVSKPARKVELSDEQRSSQLKKVFAPSVDFAPTLAPLQPLAPISLLAPQPTAATSQQRSLVVPSDAHPSTRASPPPSGIQCSGPGCERVDDAGGAAAFNVCGRCRCVRYCSRDCQAAHWKSGHKQHCQPAAATAAPAARATAVAEAKLVPSVH